MQSFPMGRSAGPSLFHGGLSQFRRISQIQAIVGDREYYASSSENDQSIERLVGSRDAEFPRATIALPTN
ncbi:hypothetical protein [Leptospira borgpetersenii]|uniref:hypothetical protein n=1 Tax=Leptospira borgpetersenii TaxID=174 RepID=UPI0018810A97|nr:hypothetical protein [Leptospira borgpetersenii]MBE8366413.1 hypothetical protein [Leptospira borgpetersenii serovar Balcanica]MBF3350097.1 hypothetical protein [Leptospira borgpetersenii serovar Balcanica]